MAAKLLLLLAICMSAVSVPAPDPGPDINIVVRQEVNLGDEGPKSRPKEGLEDFVGGNIDTYHSIKLEESSEFALQHKASGMWLQPENHNNDAHIILNPFNDDCRFKVERVPDTLLVHVKHVASGKYWHPKGGNSYPPWGSFIVLYEAKPYYTQFKFNQDKQIIQHQSGRIMAPNEKDNRPGVWTWFQDDEINAQFRVVHYNEPTKPFLIYGDADVTSNWRLVFSLNKPADVSFTFQEEVTVGHSKSDSSTTTNTFAWEVTAKAQYWFAEMSASLSVANEVTRSSAETWSKQITQTVAVTVAKGETTAIWQREFKASQLGHFSVQQSNQYCETNNSSNNPNVDRALCKLVYTE